MRGRRLLLALALTLTCVGVGAPVAAAGVQTGLADGSPAFFDAPAFRALGVRNVRLVLPWDAGTRAGPWDAWLDRADAAGDDVLVALEHAQGSGCPDVDCTLPPPASYAASLEALLARHPRIAEVTAWNEPNHATQPTFADPAAAAAYFDIAHAACARHGCTAVAGDMLDDSDLGTYLQAYQAALGSTPSVWGLHDYYDTTYLRRSGLDTMLGAVRGPVWLTETGGIVSLSEPDGTVDQPYDEQRGAQGVAWAYDQAASEPRVARLYLYQWQAARAERFDSALLGYDGAPRPAYDVVRRNTPGVPDAGGDLSSSSSAAAARRAAAARAAAVARAALRLGSGRLRLLAGGRLELQLACVAGGPTPAGCRSDVRLRVAGHREARLAVRLARGLLARRVVRLSERARRALARGPRRATVAFCNATGHCGRVQTLTVTRPLQARR